MKITDIKAQVKRQGRYSIYVDGKYSFSLSENELMNSGIRIGREYSAEELEGLKQRAVLDKAFMRAYDLLSRRSRSEWEMREFLKRKDYDEETINIIISTLSDKGYIDDQKFAHDWVRNRRLLKPVSKLRLRQELKQKRLNDEVVSTAIAEDETSETDVLKQLVERKRTQTRYQDDQKLMQYLLRQGFRYDEVKEAMKDENI